MRTAVIDGTQVVNVIEAGPGFELPGFLLVPTETAGPGWGYIDGEFVPPPAPEPEPDPVPQSCTRRQGRLALLSAGLLDDVEDAIAAIPDPAQQRAAQIEYEADTWERDNAFLQAMWAQLGGTPEQLDDLFREAVTL